MCITNQTMQHDRKKVNDQTADGAQLYAETFLYDVFLNFLHTIPLRMMNCSQGINQKKSVY